MEKLISVIILNWNGADYLSDCLDSVLAQDYRPVEIIVVDNGSEDGSAEIVKSRYPEVRLVENNANLGFAAGNNVGIRQAKGEYIVILNNDAELHPRCLAEMRRAIDTSPMFGCCASKIYLKFEDNLLDAAGIAVCPDGLSIGRGRLENGDLYDKEEGVFFGSGCCMMCRREMLEDVKAGDQYFDESFFMYAEDTDLGWRARLRGWKAIYTPEAVVYHLHSAAGGSYSPSKAFLVERNRMWIQVKCFPVSLILLGLLYALARYSVQAYGAFCGKGAAGRFVGHHSRPALAFVLAKAVLSGLWGLPACIGKRRKIYRQKKISAGMVFGMLKDYGISARRVALTG